MSSSSSGRRRATDRHYSAEEQALDQISKEAEERIQARRQARAEAREIRMKEIERQQKEEEEKQKRQEGLSETPKSISSYSSSRRGSNDSTDTDTSSKDSRDPKDQVRDLKRQLHELEDKYKQAMVTNAQLDNIKTSHVFQIELLKEQIEEQEESLTETNRQYKDKSRDYEMLKRDFESLKLDLEGVKQFMEVKDKLLQESGLVIVSSEEGQLTLTKCSDKSSIPTPTLGSSIISEEAADLLKKAGEGTLGKTSVKHSVSHDEISVVFIDNGTQTDDMFDVNGGSLVVDKNLGKIQITGDITSVEIESKLDDSDVVDFTQDKNLVGEEKERKEESDVREGIDPINSNIGISEKEKEFKISVEHVDGHDKNEHMDEIFFDSQSELVLPEVDSEQDRIKEIKNASMRAKQSHLLSESCVSIESDVTYHRDSDDELNQLEISEFVASYMAENNGEKARQPPSNLGDMDFYLNENKDDNVDDFNEDLDIEQARLSILGKWENEGQIKQVESSVSDAQFVSASESVGDFQDDKKVDIGRVSYEGRATGDIPVFSKEFDEVFNSVPEPRPESVDLVGEKEKHFVKEYVMEIVENSMEKVQSEMDESLLIKRQSLTAENIDIRISKRHYSEDLVEKISPCITRSLSRGSVDILTPITALKTEEIDEEEEQDVEFISYKLNTDVEMVLTSLPDPDSGQEQSKLPVISGFGVCYTGNDADADVEEIGAYRGEVIDLNSNICSEVIPMAVESNDKDGLINPCFNQDIEQVKEEQTASADIDDKVPCESGSNASDGMKLQNSDDCNTNGEYVTDHKLEQHIVEDEKVGAEKEAESIECIDMQPTATKDDDGQQSSTAGGDQIESAKVNKVDVENEGDVQHGLNDEDERFDKHGLSKEEHTDADKIEDPESNLDEEPKNESKEVETAALDDNNDKQEVDSEVRDPPENEHGKTEGFGGVEHRQDVTKVIETTDLDDYDDEKNETSDKNVVNVENVSSVTEDLASEMAADTGGANNSEQADKRNSVESNASKDATADFKEEQTDRDTELLNVAKTSRSASASTSGNDDEKTVEQEYGSMDKKKSKRKGSKKPDKKNTKDEKKNSKEECCVS